MPYSVMKDPGIEIRRPYGKICGMESREVKVVGLIKNLRVHPLSYLDISTLTYVVAIDLLIAYHMLLSRKWSIGMVGSMQMDLSYALIPNFDSPLTIVYRESYYFHHVESFLKDSNVNFVEEHTNYAFFMNKF